MDLGMVDLQRRAQCCVCSCTLAEARGEADAGPREWGTAKAFGCARDSAVQFTAECTLGCV